MKTIGKNSKYDTIHLINYNPTYNILKHFWFYATLFSNHGNIKTLYEHDTTVHRVLLGPMTTAYNQYSNQHRMIVHSITINIIQSILTPIWHALLNAF